MRRALAVRSVKTHMRLFLIASIGVGIVLRFVHLGKQSLWVDELLTILNGHVGQTITATHVFRNLQGPMTSLMIHFWGALGTRTTLHEHWNPIGT